MLAILEHPYDDEAVGATDGDTDPNAYAAKPPAWAHKICVTCSS